MRVYIIATILNATGRPIVLWMLPDLPDLVGPDGKGIFFSYREVMEKVGFGLNKLKSRGIIPENASITMDALFPYTDMLKLWLSQGYGVKCFHCI